MANVICVLQLGFVLLTVFWEFNFPPFMVLVIAILNDGNYSYWFLNLHVKEHSSILFYFLKKL